jgi:hypothetical protein
LRDDIDRLNVLVISHGATLALAWLAAAGILAESARATPLLTVALTVSDAPNALNGRRFIVPIVAALGGI